MPKTYDDLFTKICSFENLLSAYYKARKGKRSSKNVQDFDFNLEHEVLSLQRELLDGSYRPGGYRSFYVYDPKKRLIKAAPFRDRVVHHALCNVIEPIFDKTFIYDSYACRKGKGTHKAIGRMTEFVRKNEYVLKCDIQKYFPNIDHEILLDIIGRKIKDRRTMDLIGLIVGSDRTDNREYPPIFFPGDDLLAALRPRGIPIGNLTSQFFANIYLNGLDHFIKSDLGCRFYIRYVDDFAVLDDDKKRLHEVKEQIDEYLKSLRLRIHPRKCNVFPVRCGVDFLGFRVYRDHKLLRKINGIRFTKKLRKMRRWYERGLISQEKVMQSVNSWVAHASFGDTWGLRRSIFQNFDLQGFPATVINPL